MIIIEGHSTIMRIGITADGDDLQAWVSDDIGHCPYFIILDTRTMDFEVVENEYKDVEAGAGMYVAKAIADLGLDAVITGGIGMHGYEILHKAGVMVVSDEEGTVEEAVKVFKRRHPED